MAYTIYTNSASMSSNTIIGTSGTYSIAAATGPLTYSNSWSNGSINPAAVVIQGDAEFHGKVKIDGKDLAETLKTVQDRLSILVPDPALLDKYQALQQAYEHYKMLEALCIDEANKNK